MAQGWSLAPVFSCLASSIFCGVSWLGPNLIDTWVCMELSVICLIPCFFINEKPCSLTALLVYLVVMTLCSCVFLISFVTEVLFSLIMLGFYLKFGLVPFYNWLYSIIINTNWWNAMVLTVIYKATILIIAYFAGMSISLNNLCHAGACATLLYTAVAYWYNSSTWYHRWCHMTLGSGCVVFSVAFSMGHADLLELFMIYGWWGVLSIVVVYMVSSSNDDDGALESMVLVVWILTLPISFTAYFKVILMSYILYCPWPITVCWIIYTISEQIYFTCLLFGVKGSKGSKSDFSKFV